MDKNNNKVPIAVLSCFLIAFILQGILKISGVFIFEKALDWDIFRIIDSNIYLQVVYYSLTNLINVYCLSFALSSRCYSRSVLDYVIMILGTFAVTSCRLLLKTPFWVEYVYDAIMYIVIPIIITLRTKEKYKLLKNNFTNGVTITAIHIMLYFLYLGLGYWSLMLNSIIATEQVVIYASGMFLYQFERYIGIILLMLSLNTLIKIFKKKEG